MSWVVDTCLVIDVLDHDPVFGRESAELLDSLTREGLSLCPISYVELAPAFLGDRRRQSAFLTEIGVAFAETWEWADTQRAHQAWDRYVTLRRARKTPRRPVADILIGAFASGRKGILTRNPDDFRPFFPTLKIITPARAKP